MLFYKNQEGDVIPITGLKKVPRGGVTGPFWVDLINATNLIVISFKGTTAAEAHQKAQTWIDEVTAPYERQIQGGNGIIVIIDDFAQPTL